jgi:hypothetical protein
MSSESAIVIVLCLGRSGAMKEHDNNVKDKPLGARC